MLKISTERVINILPVIGRYPVTMETLALACCVLCPSLNILLLLWLLKWALPRGEKNEGSLTTETRIKPVMNCVNFWLQWTTKQMVNTLPHHACMISFKTSSGPDGPAKSQYNPTYLYMYHCLSDIYTTQTLFCQYTDYSNVRTHFLQFLSGVSELLVVDGVLQRPAHLVPLLVGLQLLLLFLQRL